MQIYLIFSVFAHEKSYLILLGSKSCWNYWQWTCWLTGTFCYYIRMSLLHKILRLWLFPFFSFFLLNLCQFLWSDLSNDKLCAVKPSVSPWSDPCHKNRWWETTLSYTNLTHSYFMVHSLQTLCMTCNTSSLYPTFCYFVLVMYTAAQGVAFPHLTHLSFTHLPPP